MADGDPEIPDPVIHFPGMPHNVHGALWRVLDYAGDPEKAKALLQSYWEMLQAQHHP